MHSLTLAIGFGSVGRIIPKEARRGLLNLLPAGAGAGTLRRSELAELHALLLRLSLRGLRNVHCQW